MKKIKFTVYADEEEFIEFNDDATEKEIENAFERWIDNNTQCFWEDEEVEGE